MNDEQKPWYASRTIIGALSAMVAGGAGMAGYAIDPESAVEITTSAVALFGGAMALWGRIKATKTISQ